MDDNVNVYEVFGLEPPAEEPAPEGGNKQEPAAPADTGENEQESAAPATEEDGGEDGQPEQQPEPQTQTKEQRAENARRRRQQEVNNAVEAALKKEREAQTAKLSDFFKRAKLKNNFTGKDILSLEDFEAWDQASKTAAMQKDLKAGKLTPEAPEQLIEGSPTMQRARALTEQAEQTARETKNAQYAQKVEQELTEIRKLDPTVQSLTDIIRMPTGQRFAELVQKNGLNYLDAFRLANLETLQAQARNTAAAGARMADRSKEHLRKTDMRGQGTVEVPEDVKASYRLLNPGMSDAEIQKDYQKRTQNAQR